MKKLLLLAACAFFALQGISAQSKVAVLDASLGEGVHPNAAAIVADTINEQFVKSPDFIAIDRAYISNIQAEKEFQLSGEVNDKDIKELGVTFGADFLCIANVSLLGSTYTVSARLISVESAQVVAQESYREQGTIDVLFHIAEVVGSKFVGTDLPVSTPSQPSAATATVVQPQTPPPIAPAPKPEKWTPKKRTSVSFMIPGYMGDTGNDSYWDENYYSFYEWDEYLTDLYDYYGIYADCSSSSWGVDLHTLVPMKFIYLSFGARYTSYSVDLEYTYDYDDYDESYDIFNTLDLSIGAGAILSPVNNLQIYAGASAGYMMFLLGSGYGGDAEDPYWGDYAGSLAGGFQFGVETGFDYFLGDFCLSMRYNLSFSPDLTGDDVFTDDYQEESGGDTSFGVHGLILGLGFSM